MLSTKSRLLTRLPGAINRISMVFSGSRPAAGQTSGTQQQRDEAARGILLIGGERQRQQIGRGIERRAPQRSESLFGHGSFVGWNRKPALRDVKQTLRSPLVASRIVQHALRQTIGVQ
jgi:hypothetical protein